MHLHHVAADTALMVIVCVAAMFFHPIAFGSYSAVHGPTTALRARDKAWLVLACIAGMASRRAARLASSVTLVPLSMLHCTPLVYCAANGLRPLPLRC